MWRARLPPRTFPVTVSGSTLNRRAEHLHSRAQSASAARFATGFRDLSGWVGNRQLSQDSRSMDFLVFTLPGRPIRPNFPTNGTVPAFQATPIEAGTHGFLSKFAFPTSPASGTYALAYSTYLSGNGTDNITGLAIDTAENAYVTGDTTSTDPVSNSFPANANGFQTASNSPANPQFFATMINTLSGSITYSTLYGGGYFARSARGRMSAAASPWTLHRTLLRTCTLPARPT